MIRRPPRSTLSSSSAASDVYKRQVLAPGVGRARAGDDASEARVREDIDPGERSLPLVLEDDDVLAAVTREAAEPVLHDERRRLDRRLRPLVGWLLVRHDGDRMRRLRFRAVQLLRQIPAFAGEDRTGDRIEEKPLGVRHRVAPEKEDSSRFLLPCAPGAALDELDELLVHLVAI